MKNIIARLREWIAARNTGVDFIVDREENVIDLNDVEEEEIRIGVTVQVKAQHCCYLATVTSASSHPCGKVTVAPLLGQQGVTARKRSVWKDQVSVAEVS